MKNVNAFVSVAVAFVTGLNVPMASAEETLDIPQDVRSAHNDLDCAKNESLILNSEDGNKYEVGCSVVGGDSKSSLPFVNHWAPYESHTWHCGSSTIKNQQIGYLWYRGSVYASGDYGSG